MKKFFATCAALMILSVGIICSAAENLNFGGVPVERVDFPEGTFTALQLHGGGYILELTKVYREVGVMQAEAIGAKTLYLVDYRIAPENIYPAALDDVEKVYCEILKSGVAPDEIIIFGDSSGGNLAVELSLRLKEKNLPQPAALVLISPWATFETKFPSRRENRFVDKFLGVGTMFYDAVSKRPAYAPKDMKLNDPRLSPIYADLSGLPPMLIQVGGNEIFFDEDFALAKKAAADGVAVTLIVYPEMSHDFAVIKPDLPQAAVAYADIKDFCERLGQCKKSRAA